MGTVTTAELTAEAFGTYCLVLAGTGAIVINDVSGGLITHVGVALVFGLVVMAMIDTVGDVSGAHLNPAVTLGFWIAGRLSGRRVLPFALAQLTGALLASVTLRVIFSGHATLGATQPAGAPWQSFLLEILLTTMLMMAILSVSTGSREKGLNAGITVGSVVGLAALFAGPISGASMNPARSLAPAIVTLRMDWVWLYLLAPCIGSALAVPLCGRIRGHRCCSRPGPGAQI